MRIVVPALLLGALAACVARDPQVVAPDSLGLAATPATAAISVDGSQMTTQLQPRFGCAAYTYPLDGRAAFEAAMRSAAATNARPNAGRVDIVGEQVSAAMDATSGIVGGAAISVTVRATLRSPGAASLEATGRSTAQTGGLGGCDSIGPTLAEAYRDALRALGAQVAARLRGAS